MAIDISRIKSRKPKKEQESAGFLSFLKKDISFSKGFGDKSKESFYSELSLLLNSGVDVGKALDILLEELSKNKEKNVITQVKNLLISGKSFSESLELVQGFSPYEFYSIRIGEETGKLEMVLTQLSTFYKRKLKQRRQVMNALSYPIIVIITAFAAVGFMMNFVVPIFTEVFKRFQGELPGITKSVIAMSEFFTNYFLLILLAIGGVVALIIAYRKQPLYRKYSSMILLKMPIFGSITQKVYTARFCHSMALLISAKVPMLRAIELVEKMIGFYPYELAMVQIKEGILKGQYLYQTMEKYPIFDRKMVALVKVAEEVNKMDEVFNELSTQYNEIVENSMSILSNLLEPLLIILVGLLVGVILIAMYLPLFQLSTSFS
ncbi:MAG: type II secretion system F family protein [Sedimentibacter sp.]|nr:type II secretion system F family protein [Sedimentibacter sp.]